MANELSRISDRLIRARERNWHHATAARLPPPARREPTPRELPPDPPEKPNDSASQSKRPASTWVAIHVQLRHEPDPTARVFERAPELDEDEEYVEAPPVDFDEPSPREARKALPAQALGDAFFVPRILASHSAQSGSASGAPGMLQYLATRALSAYLTQSSYASAATGEPRMLDVHA